MAWGEISDVIEQKVLARDDDLAHSEARALLRLAGGHKYGAQAMVEDQFTAFDYGDEWKRAHGQGHPIHPAR
eukprot:2051590-Alexandrium_andersonii.AAC.1